MGVKPGGQAARGGHRQPWCTSGLAAVQGPRVKAGLEPPGSLLLAGESRADSTGPMRKGEGSETRQQNRKDQNQSLQASISHSFTIPLRIKSHTSL